MNLKNFKRGLGFYLKVFCFLLPLTFSFNFWIIPDLGGFIQVLTSGVVSLVFGIKGYTSAEDSLSFLFNLLCVAAYSLGLVLLLSYVLRLKQRILFEKFIMVALRYYLSLMLMIYGFDKLYKFQFFTPEPNTLYTRLVNIPQDLLYWSTMGTSYMFSVVSGFVEVLGGILLLFSRFRLLGLLLSLVAISQVVLINFSFDITVKIFSSFLLLINLLLLKPYYNLFARLFFSRSSNVLILPKIDDSLANFKYAKPIKLAVILLFLVESNYKAISQVNFNDDLKERPFGHGAYRVINDSSEIEMVFLHRQGYLIFKTSEEEFYDYKMRISSDRKHIEMTNYEGDVIELTVNIDSDTMTLKGGDRSMGDVNIKAVKVRSFYKGDFPIAF